MLSFGTFLLTGFGYSPASQSKELSEAVTTTKDAILQSVDSLLPYGKITEESIKYLQEAALVTIPFTQVYTSLQRYYSSPLKSLDKTVNTLQHDVINEFYDNGGTNHV